MSLRNTCSGSLSGVVASTMAASTESEQKCLLESRVVSVNSCIMGVKFNSKLNFSNNEWMIIAKNLS